VKKYNFHFVFQIFRRILDGLLSVYLVRLFMIGNVVECTVLMIVSWTKTSFYNKLPVVSVLQVEWPFTSPFIVILSISCE